MTFDKILPNFGTHLNAVIVGAHGGLGAAFVEHLVEQPNIARVFALSRTPVSFHHEKTVAGLLDYIDEQSVEARAQEVQEHGGAHIVIVATGLLHDGSGMMPEKNLRDFRSENFQKSYLVNTIGPALVAKHFLPLLPRDQKCVFAALSARVGSISDNALGGWTAYRAAKAALNMVIKNAAIEVGRRNKEAIIVALHPGTVETGLSQPFQSNVPDGKLFTPSYSAGEMLKVLNGLSVNDTGKIFAYDGKEILP